MHNAWVFRPAFIQLGAQFDESEKSDAVEAFRDAEVRPAAEEEVVNFLGGGDACFGSRDIEGSDSGAGSVVVVRG